MASKCVLKQVEKLKTEFPKHKPIWKLIDKNLFMKAVVNQLKERKKSIVIVIKQNKKKHACTLRSDLPLDWIETIKSTVDFLLPFNQNN